MPEDAHAERLSPLACQILFDPACFLYTLIERSEQQLVITLPRLHLLGKRKQQPTQHVPQRRIRIAQLSPNKELTLALLIPLEHPLKVSQKLGNAVLPIVRRLLQALLLLILVVLGHRDGVVGVVRLVVEVEGRERVRQDPLCFCLVCAGEAELGA